MRHKLTVAMEQAYGELPRPKNINVVALVKGDERYIFLFHDEYEPEILRIFGRFACDPELSFTWADAAVMSQKVRNNCGKEQA